MKSTNALLAVLASTAAAQPHGHQHAHLHPARKEHQHGHELEKRVLATEVVVEWVTETVVEIIDATTTVWSTEGADTPTTLATVVASNTADAGQFFEPASTVLPTTATTPPAAAAVMEQTTSSSSSSVYVAPAEPTTTTTEAAAYVAPVVPAVEPTTSTSETPVATPVVETPTTTSVAAEETPATSVSGTTFSGKITWIGDTTGAYGACGQPYEDGKYYVAVNPSVLDCGPDGMGTPMTITANGKTISAVAQDKCPGCPVDHIDVATDVYKKLGYTIDDGGMHDNAGLTWVLSST